MSGRWLAADAGPDPADVARRAAWWRAREASLQHAPPQVRAALDAPGAPRPADVHALLDAFLPLEALTLDVHGLLRAWFGAALEALGARLDDGLLGSARSWLDVRTWLPGAPPLPAALVAALADPDRAHELVFALFCSARLGSGWGRYPAALAAAVAACRPAAGGPIRAWDAGCATGEGSWELALALASRFPGRAVQVVGTTPWPLERLMARRAAWPHDPRRTAAHAARLADAPARCRVRFELGDLAAGAPGGPFDLVVCHGVLGEAIAAPAAQRLALGRLAGALAPAGALSLADAFRADRAAAAAALAREELSARGLRAGPGGCYVRGDTPA